MKVITETQDHCSEILFKIERFKSVLDYMEKWETTCQAKSWSLSEEHFDEKEFIQSEIDKAKTHYITLLKNLIELANTTL